MKPFFLAGGFILLLTAALDAQHKKREQPSAATLACGSEVPWQASLDAALEKAAGIQRPVFWYVPSVAGSPMDRKPVIDLYMMCGPFANEEVATLLARKFVPVKAVAKGELQKKYGLAPLAFIEPGFVVLAPDGEVIKQVDKITTLHSDWMVWQLREALGRRPELAGDSAEVAAARTSRDAGALAEALLAEGDAEGALAAIGPGSELEGAERKLLRARIAARLHHAETAHALLDELAHAPGLGDPVRFTRARLLLGQGRLAEASSMFEDLGERSSFPSRQEAAFLAGVCLHQVGRDEEARARWKKVAAFEPASRWTRKASAELQRLGPFSRAFERFDWLPEDAFLPDPDGTRVPRTEAEIPLIVRRSISLLLATQKGRGCWDDSNYDFGGTDSLPNVYVAGTALAALALDSWRETDPKAIETAIARALTYLLDEQNVATEDKDEIVWAHAYRLLLFERLLRQRHPRSEDIRVRARAIVTSLLHQQIESGGWAHEYPNPFATATVVHALTRIHGVGIPIGKDAIARAAQALGRARGQDGTFSYGFGGKGSAPPSSAGRAPICELALLLGGASDQERLGRAIALAREHHDHLERVRKYDDHAGPHGNGGFFFWYALHGRLLAIEALDDAGLRDSELEQLRALVLSLPEIDGGFVDSHELGKSYGTAMGLICLKGTLGEKE